MEHPHRLGGRTRSTMRPNLPVVGAVVAGALLTVAPALLSAQAPRSADSTGEALRTVVPGRQYGAGWLHRLFFGTRYRRLWTTAVAVPRLDLDATAGGLTPIRRGGFGQTRSLHFRGADRRRYVFRSVDKDPTQGLPEELEGTFVDAVVQDQISANHPFAPLVVAPLLEALGILHVEPLLAVMPDDPRLGEYRDEFAGMLGTFEERPNEGPDDSPGFEGFTRIVQTETMFTRLEEDSEHRVHAADFLAARLFDLYVNDRDRHVDQWRWAREDVGDLNFWRPIPRDRDQAFVRLDGLVMSVVRLYRPQFVGFSSEYSDIDGAMYNGRGLDRRLLSELTWPTWDSVVTAFQVRLTDSVIEAAVQHLPPEAYVLDGARLASALRQRRDGLRAAARRFYELLAKYVDIHATDENEVAWADRRPNGDVELRIARRRSNRPPRAPYFRRVFHARETQEIRLYLQGGDDEIVVRGTVPRSIVLRVIGGGGDDVFVDSSVVGGGESATYFYDGRDDNEFVLGPGTRVDEHRPDPFPAEESFMPPPPPNAFDAPEQNWGGWWYPSLWFALDPDLGLTVGGGPTIYRYGFRKYPYRSRLDLRVGFATGTAQPRVRVDLELPALSRPLAGLVSIRAPSIGITHFSGFGNETPPAEDDDRYEVRQLQYAILPSLRYRVSRRTSAEVGLVAKLVDTETRTGSVLDATTPIGIGTFGLVGGRLRIEVDTRDAPIASRSGGLVALEGSVFPPIISVPETFAKLRGEVRSYFTAAQAPARPTLALRVSGERVFGEFPFFEAAFLGGPESLRGFLRDRFAGDAAVSASAELRLYLTRVRWVVPGELGVFGLGDLGRVFVDGESSDTWHSAAGGGIWLAPIGRANTMSLAVAASPEGTGVYFTAGFMF